MRASEQNVVYGGGGARRDQNPDICVWKRGQSLRVSLDCFTHLTIETKPGQRIGKGIVTLQREAIEHFLCRSAKPLNDGLRFASAPGISSHATSAIGSLVYVQVLQVKLVDPGKVSSKVELVSSGPLPLVTRAVFDRWFESDKRYPGPVEKMRGLLFPGVGMSKEEKSDCLDPSVVDENKSVVSPGILALYSLMASSPRSPRADRASRK